MVHNNLKNPYFPLPYLKYFVFYTELIIKFAIVTIALSKNELKYKLQCVSIPCPVLSLSVRALNTPNNCIKNKLNVKTSPKTRNINTYIHIIKDIFYFPLCNVLFDTFIILELCIEGGMIPARS